MRKHLHFKSIDSTSSYLKREYAHFDDFTFVSADYQTNGRGRYERVWKSPKKENLMFSFLLKDPFFTKNFASVSLLSGYAVVLLLESLGIKDVMVKWPNDIYINGKKACGILMEGIATEGKTDALIVGIGLNVNEVIFPEDLSASSIALAKQHFYPIWFIRHRLFKIIRNEFKKLKDGSNSYLAEIKKKNFLKDKEVTVNYRNENIRVTVVDIDENNALVVKYGEELLHLSSGEANLVK